MNIAQILSDKNARKNEIEILLQDPKVFGDQNKLREINREYRDIAGVIKIAENIFKLEQAITQAEDTLANETDPEMIELAKNELLNLNAKNLKTRSCLLHLYRRLLTGL